MVELLKQNPTHLIATCRDVTKATELNRLASKHSNLKVVELEMTDYSSHKAFVAEIEKIVGEKGLNFLIQNAGLNVEESSQWSPEIMAKIYEVNVISPLQLTRQLMPLLKKSAATGERTIASFLSSYLSSVELNTDNRFIAYRMSKSALNQGVRTMANGHANDSIEFVLLHPGIFFRLDLKNNLYIIQ